MQQFFTWLSGKSIAHCFAIVRFLERDNQRLREENLQLKDQLNGALDKIYLAMGLYQMPVPQLVEGEQFNTGISPATPSQMMEEAEAEDWATWQEQERRRLADAALVHREFMEDNLV